MVQPTLDESELTFLTTLSKTQSLPITISGPLGSRIER